MPRSFWLVKSEPHVFSFEDLWRAPGRTTPWDGVRNYQARNFLRDRMRVGDGVLYYHSNCPEPGVAGIAEVASESRPDPTQFDPEDPHFDPKADPRAPRWFLVDIRAVAPMPVFVPLARLRGDPELEGLALLRRGNRLSVLPVEAPHWRRILHLGGAGTGSGPRKHA